MAFRADRLRALREQRGLSQRELARLCGVGETQIFKYETNVGDPSSTNLKIIADQLDTSTDYLLGRTDDLHDYLGDSQITDDERSILETYRHDGWPGVAHLSIERLAK